MTRATTVGIVGLMVFSASCFGTESGNPPFSPGFDGGTGASDGGGMTVSDAGATFDGGGGDTDAGTADPDAGGIVDAGAAADSGMSLCTRVAERCNDTDDDLDGTVDEDCECGESTEAPLNLEGEEVLDAVGSETWTALLTQTITDGMESIFAETVTSDANAHVELSDLSAPGQIARNGGAIAVAAVGASGPILITLGSADLIERGRTTAGELGDGVPHALLSTSTGFVALLQDADDSIRLVFVDDDANVSATHDLPTINLPAELAAGHDGVLLAYADGATIRTVKVESSVSSPVEAVSGTGTAAPLGLSATGSGFTLVSAEATTNGLALYAHALDTSGNIAIRGSLSEVILASGAITGPMTAEVAGRFAVLFDRQDGCQPAQGVRLLRLDPTIFGGGLPPAEVAAPLSPSASAEALHLLAVAAGQHRVVTSMGSAVQLCPPPE